MPKQPKKAKGTKMGTGEHPKARVKVTWANASDQIQVALACLERDTESGLSTLRTKIENMAKEAKAVGEAAKATSKREH